MSRRCASLLHRKPNFHEIGGVCPWHGVMFHLRKVMPTQDDQSSAKEWLMEFHQGAIQHGTESVIMIQTRLHRPDHTLVHSCKYKITAQNPSLIHLHIPICFFVFEIDGQLAGVRGLHTGRQACFFSAPNSFTKKYNGLDEISAAPRRLVLPQKNRHDLKYVFDLEIAHSMGTTFFQARDPATVHFGSLPPESLLKKETLVKSVTRRHQQRMMTIEGFLSQSQDITKECHHRTHSFFCGRTDPAPGFDVARKFILTPNPWFTVSMREPGPVNEKNCKRFLQFK